MQEALRVICPSCFGTRFGTCAICSVEVVATRPPCDVAPKEGRSLTDFGTVAFPLRASGLPKLVMCPWEAAMEFLFECHDESGPAADTGSATHAAVAAWHTMGHDAASAVKSMVDRSGEFPKADFDEATVMFLNYTRDPRNVKAEVVEVERKVSFVLPPAPEDETQKEIAVNGKVDQIRIVDGLYRVYDLKTSKKSGLDLMRQHQYQIAAYVVGASHIFGKPVHPGALICPRHYVRGILPETEPAGVFFQFPWTFEDARFILWGLRRIVASIRSGEVWHQGGEHCRWCPAGSPDVCLPRLRSVTDPSTMRISLPMLLQTEAVANIQRVESHDVFESF